METDDEKELHVQMRKRRTMRRMKRMRRGERRLIGYVYYQD